MAQETTIELASARMVIELETFLRGEAPPLAECQYGWLLDDGHANVVTIPGHLVPNSVQVMVRYWQGTDSDLIETLVKTCRVDCGTASTWVRIVRAG